jgi:hypothetical protein
VEHDQDPYRTCEQHCTHDLSHGVGVIELLSEDGPYPPSQLLVNLSAERGTLFGEALEEIRAAAAAAVRT